MRILFFGPLQALGIENDPGLLRVASTTPLPDFVRVLDECRAHTTGRLCLWLPLSDDKQQVLQEFLTHYEGDIVLISSQIDFGLRRALSELFICQWGALQGVQETTAMAPAVRDLRTDCRHRRALGVWLRRQGRGLRREDRMFARALDTLSAPAAGARPA